MDKSDNKTPTNNDDIHYIGHKDPEDGKIQALKDHSQGVSDLAEDFASAFHEQALGKIIGLYHDIGKYSQEFQRYIKQGGGKKVDHSTAGMKEFLKVGMIPAAFCVAGHHGGLPDAGGDADDSQKRTLKGKLHRDTIPDYHMYLSENSAPHTVSDSLLYQDINKKKDIFAMMNYVRMLFSCLVDADFLDTEKFMSQGKVHREGFDSLSILKTNLDAYIHKYFLHPNNTMNQKRCEILQRCIEAGDKETGHLFNLTIPTGGGKTLSSLAFALHHAVKKGNVKSRIIYVIPYTSIIEQNAEVFRKIVGDKNVVEHHMNVEYNDDDNADETLERKKLATENWDAPLIVTTNVQFFESLFANKTSKCRKLHNIVNSIIVFDEAQMIPVEFLQPCMRMIDELTQHYGCTVVLCTATQPSLGNFFPNQKLIEICSNISDNYCFFRRTQIKVLSDKLSEESLAERLNQHDQVLCIVNTKKKAQSLYDQLKGEGIYHLSTNLYPEHRSRTLEEIKKRLMDKLPCKVISTSLIECGVDISFPVVYRELAGLDSIIQAAGRCNREGDEPAENSFVYVFETENASKNSNMQLLQEVTRMICREYSEDISAPEAIACYFDRLHLFKGDQLDGKDILRKIQEQPFSFESIAKDFVFINTPMAPVLIPRDEEAICISQRLRNGERSRKLLRDASRYSVNVFCGTDNQYKPQQPYDKLFAAGKVEKIDNMNEGISILLDMTLYDEKKGLQVNIEDGQGVFC